MSSIHSTFTLKDPSLLQQHAFVDGAWVQSSHQFAVHNPATGEQIASVSNLNKQDAVAAINAAQKAFPAWSALTGKERANIMRHLV